MIGSQAILGSVPNPPAELVQSAEADLFPRHHPERADLIDGAIGEATLFNETFGYYAHAVSPEMALAPAGWLDRLVAFKTEATRGATGWCIEPHDLVLAKAAAGRSKDFRFLHAAIGARIVDPRILLERLPTLPPDRAVVGPIRTRPSPPRSQPGVRFKALEPCTADRAPGRVSSSPADTDA